MNQKHALKIEKLSHEHACQVAQLHIKGIPTGFISSLGTAFVTALYEAIAQSHVSFGVTAVEDDTVVGFVTFTANVNALYKSIIRKHGLRFVFLLAGKMLSFKRIKRICETLFYPGKVEKLELPSAELLSIVIAPQARGKGLARKLIMAGIEECTKRSVKQVKVMVACHNESANALYKKCGFEFAAQVDSHGIKSNIYVTSIN